MRAHWCHHEWPDGSSAVKQLLRWLDTAGYVWRDRECKRCGRIWRDRDEPFTGIRRAA